MNIDRNAPVGVFDSGIGGLTVARDFTATDERMLNHFDIEQSEEFKTTKYFCKTHFDMKKIKNEEDHYVPLPKIYEFKNDREKEIMLNRNFKRVNDEVEKMVKELLGMP